MAPLLFATACAGDFIPNADFSPIFDFSVGNPAQDMSGGDLAGARDLGGHDLATPDLAGSDLSMPDLSRPPDLAQFPMCDLAPVGDAGSEHLRLAGAGAAGALYVARFDGSWGAFQIDNTHAFSDVALGNVLVARQTDATLDWTRFDVCTGLQSSSQIAALSTFLRPSIAGSDVIFRGNFDANLYHTHWDGSSWSNVSTQSMLTTNLEPLALFESGALHVFFSGTNTTIYDGTISDGAGGGAAIAAGGGQSAYAPAATVASDGTVFMAFTGNDTNVYFSSLPSGGSWSAATKVCPAGTCLATSMKAPSLATGASGAPVLVYVGTDGHVYGSAFASNKWSSPVVAYNASETTAYRAALATGVGGFEAELVYVRASDGAPVHARLSSGTWGSFSALGGAVFQSAPALASW